MNLMNCGISDINHLGSGALHNTARRNRGPKLRQSRRNSGQQQDLAAILKAYQNQIN
jgi:hypothetical protein